MAEPSTPISAPPRQTLVTGGAGFIGSHLVERLVARGDEVTVIDNLATGRASNLDGMSDRVRFIREDLAAALSAYGPGVRFDRIFHLAAAVGVKRVIEDPISAIETNIDQTLAVLRFAQTHGPRGAGAPLLLASSSEVYGKPSTPVFREDDDTVYGPTTISRWSYAASKALDEHLALAFHSTRGVPVVVARLFNTVGPRQVGDYGMVLPRFVRAAIDGRDLEVYGDGGQTRCFCDVRDVVGGLAALLDCEPCRGRVFNVGSDQPISMLELAKTVIRVLGSSSAVCFVPYGDAYGPGFEDLRQRRPDVTRVREAIGFAPVIGLEQTIRDLAAEIGRGLAMRSVTSEVRAGRAGEHR